MTDERLSEALARLAVVEDQLREANETLDAIRNGEVDAVVVGGRSGQIVYTLENADRPYRVLVERMKEGAVTMSDDGVILYCNHSFAELVGIHSEHVVGGSIFDYVHERDQLRRMLAARGTGGESAEISLIRAKGPSALVNVSIVELAMEEGDGRVLCAIVTDLSLNYARARELADANTRLAAVIVERTRAEQSLAIALEAADMGSWDLTLTDDASARSPRHDAIFGHEPMLKRWNMAILLDHFIEEDRDAVRAAFDAAVSTGRLEFERRIHRASDGALRWIHAKGRTFYLNGLPERVAGVVVDVTDRRLIDEQLRQAQKMEAIGQLTGGIAHDFNNLLMIIGGSLETLSRRTVLDEQAERWLSAARLGVARGAKLNEQLLAFARRQEMHVQTLCINELLPDFETLLDRAVGETVSVQIDQAADLWHCATDAHQLETAILNLAINARDAMERGGSLRLSTQNVTLSAAEAQQWEASPGDYVMVSLSDNGTGIEASVLERVFEPFFTTKDVGKGTGLGLSQVYGFAKQSGGFVSIRSTVDRGTTVSIHLPRTAPPTATHVDPEPRAGVESGEGVVLLVEDDADVRATTCAMLEELGYTVRSTASGREALDALGADDRVDIVFSDVIMASGMTGIELARLIKAERPHLPVLLTSGYTAQRVSPTALNDDLPVLRKPYVMDELAEALDRAMRRR